MTVVLLHKPILVRIDQSEVFLEPISCSQGHHIVEVRASWVVAVICLVEDTGRPNLGDQRLARK